MGILLHMYICTYEYSSYMYIHTYIQTYIHTYITEMRWDEIGWVVHYYYYYSMVPSPDNWRLPCHLLYSILTAFLFVFCHEILILIPILILILIFIFIHLPRNKKGIIRCKVSYFLVFFLLFFMVLFCQQRLVYHSYIHTGGMDGYTSVPASRVTSRVGILIHPQRRKR